MCADWRRLQPECATASGSATAWQAPLGASGPVPHWQAQAGSVPVNITGTGELQVAVLLCQCVCDWQPISATALIVPVNITGRLGFYGSGTQAGSVWTRRTPAVSAEPPGESVPGRA